jgi:hypothetical protein
MSVSHIQPKPKTMFKTIMTAGVSFLMALSSFDLRAQEKIDLQEPKQAELLQELKDYPVGVNGIKYNKDGSFRSLVVKATVEIEDVLGAEKGKRIAREEAEIQCKKDLANWLNEHHYVVGGYNKTDTFQTKGQSAGKNQEGQESKTFLDSQISFSQANLQGLSVVSSEISPDGKEFTLVMAWTQKSLNQSVAMAKALSGSGPIPETGGSEVDRPKPEIKVNRDALEELR